MGSVVDGAATIFDCKLVLITAEWVYTAPEWLLPMLEKGALGVPSATIRQRVARLRRCATLACCRRRTSRRSRAGAKALYAVHGNSLFGEEMEEEAGYERGELRPTACTTTRPTSRE